MPNPIFLSTPSSQRATPVPWPVLPISVFLSTPSSQRATYGQEYPCAADCISIHALFAEGDLEIARIAISPCISIHALFAEGDFVDMGRVPRPWIFLSTPSSQRATVQARKAFDIFGISIHALFAEGDMWWWTASRMLTYFYPRPLRRGRPHTASLC